MSKLKAVAPKTVAPKKPAIMIYGEPGAGKTWASLDFPDVYFIDSERGATREHYTDKLEASGGVYMGVEQGSQDFDEVVEQFRALRSEKHDRKTVVLDSYSKLWSLELIREGERLGDKDAYGASKKPAIRRSARLESLINTMDMNVILIAHRKAAYENDKQEGWTFDGYEKFGHDLDMILEIRKQGNSRIAFVKKSRIKEFPQGSTFPWSYAEFSERYGKDVIEKAGKSVEVATDEQLGELSMLLTKTPVPEPEQAKWMKKACVTTFEDMEATKVQAIIDMLKKRISE